MYITYTFSTQMSEAGAVYVLRRSPSGQWTQIAKLTAASPSASSRFGAALSSVFIKMQEPVRCERCECKCTKSPMLADLYAKLCEMVVIWTKTWCFSAGIMLFLTVFVPCFDSFLREM